MQSSNAKLRLQLRPSPRNLIGVFLSLVGFVLILLCLVGSRSSAGKALHFAHITDKPPGPLHIYVSWQGYCIEDESGTRCQTDDGVMMLPFDVTIVNMFNGSYPQLFADPVTLDSDLFPLSAPSPAHNPKLYAASVLCLLCGGAATVIGIAWSAAYPSFQDQHFSRGFFALGAAVLALLLLAQSTIMYQNGVDMLNMEYPHLQATVGPNQAITGVAFAAFSLSGYFYLHGCFSKSDDNAYSPL